MKIFELTQNYVENYPLNTHPWFIFASKCNQAEFLYSQQGFYYAVQGFSQILFKLASNISNSKLRILIMNNLWEEHGKGDPNLYHTSTYFKYLQSLGFQDKEANIPHNPFVTSWVNLVLSKEYSASEYAMYIAGIEFIYTRISSFISDLIKGYALYNEQDHYAKHSILDYEHANELIETSLLIQDDTYQLSSDEMMFYFKTGINDFLELYKNMVLLTENDAHNIAKEEHSFYYGREDTLINKSILNDFYAINSDKKAEVLMICSGGENALEVLSMPETHNITLIDINPHQLSLTKEKIDSIKNKEKINWDIYHKGKFEKLFEFIRNSLSEEDLFQISYNDFLSLEKLKWICENALSNKILEIVFTDNATKYSSKSFATHFYNVFIKQIKYYYHNNPKYSNINSILFNKAPLDYSNMNINPNTKIDYYHGEFLSLFKEGNKTYDLIDLSNISDWMPFDDMKAIVLAAYHHLNNNGKIVIRKLLGDYSCLDFAHNLDNVTILPKYDSTDFYTDCLLIQKN